MAGLTGARSMAVRSGLAGLLLIALAALAVYASRPADVAAGQEGDANSDVANDVLDLNQLEATGATYLERLAGVLDQPVGAMAASDERAAASAPSATPWPSRRALVLTVAPHSVDGLEFLQAHGCDLGGLIGYRNSPLGRTQRASQRLAYEVEWLRVAAACRDAPAWVAALMAEKRSDLPRLFWNATLGSDEFRVAAGRSRPAGLGDFAYLLRSLQDQQRALSQPTPTGFDGVALEDALGELSRASHIGPARAGWAVQRRVLDTAAGVITDAASRVCPQGRSTPRSRYLGNVFARFYVGALQPMLAASQQRDAAWVDALNALGEALLPVAPQAFLEWRAEVVDPGNPQSEWARTRQAVVAHAKAWQQLFAACAIDPRSLAPG